MALVVPESNFGDELDPDQFVVKRESYVLTTYWSESTLSS